MSSQLPDKLPFSKKTLHARVIISYISDYVILVGLVVGFYILDRVEPFHQHFALQNYTLHYPYAVNERIPIPLALAISGAFPAGVIAVYTIIIDGLFSHNKPVDPTTGKRKFLGKYRLKDRLWELNCGVLGLLLAQGAAFVITGALKNACGKPRPDLIDRCKPSSFDQPDHKLSTIDICTQKDNDILKDGFRSFPSGHSSSSFAGLFYLSLYLSGKLHVMDSRGEVWKTFIVMVPTLAAALVAVSRIMDARHHPFDVITGSLLGVFCGWAAYRQYFPSLSEPWKKGRAYPIRTWGTISEPPVVGAPRRVLEYEEDEVKLVNRQDEEYQGMTTSSQRRQISPPKGSDNSDRPARSFDHQAYPQRRQHGTQEDYAISSSESEGFEMQPGYRMGRQRTDSSTAQLSRYPPDTAYLNSEGSPSARYPPDTHYINSEANPSARLPPDHHQLGVAR